MPDEPLLDETPAAEQLGLPPRTLRTWRSRGKGPPFVRLGKRVKYRPQDLRAFVEQRLERPGSTGAVFA
jgi:DNA-binding transcriptional MerR regulator